MYRQQTAFLNRESPTARRLYRIVRICTLRRARFALPEFYARFQSRTTRTAQDNACRRYQALANKAWEQYEKLFYSRFPIH